MKTSITSLKALEPIKKYCYLPGDAQYFHSTKLFNGDIQRSPMVVARPPDKSKLIRVLQCCHDAQLPMTVRAGGHNVAGRAVADNAVMIDLSLLKNVDISSDSSRVIVGGGATWGQVDAITTKVNRATPGGFVPSTGVGGLTLGGGVGWLLPLYGLTSDNLIAASLLTAEGKQIRCSLEQRPELLLSLRGEGFGYGVVTEFEFKLHQVDRILGGWFVYSGSAVEKVLEVIADLLPQLAEDTMISPVYRWDGSEAVCEIDFAGFGNAQGASELMRRLASIPVQKTFTEVRDYMSLQKMTDNPERYGQPTYWKSGLRNTISTDLLIETFERFKESPTKLCQVILEHYHGAYSRTPVGGSSFRNRQYQFCLLAIGSWERTIDKFDYQISKSNAKLWARSMVRNWSEDNNSDQYINYSTELISHHTLMSDLLDEIDPNRLFVCRS